MNIVVCVKQVPDVDDIKWTKENNLDRSAMLSKMNLYDEWALDYAVKIKSKFKDAKLIAISMGPNQAKDVLYEALAKGADRAILLSDKMFSGSDTLATAKILSRAILKYVPDFHLILAGQMAQDGDTAQVPVSLAQYLEIPDVTNVVEIYNADKNQAIVSQVCDNEINMYEIQTPCLIALKRECDIKAKAKIEDYIRAQNALIEVYGALDLELSKEEVGVIGSPTMVYRAFRPEIVKEVQEVKQNQTQFILDLILKAD